MSKNMAFTSFSTICLLVFQMVAVTVPGTLSASITQPVAAISLGGFSPLFPKVALQGDSVPLVVTVVSSAIDPSVTATVDLVELANPNLVHYSIIPDDTRTKQLSGTQFETNFKFTFTSSSFNINSGNVQLQFILSEAQNATISEPSTKDITVEVGSAGSGGTTVDPGPGVCDTYQQFLCESGGGFWDDLNCVCLMETAHTAVQEPDTTFDLSEISNGITVGHDRLAILEIVFWKRAPSDGALYRNHDRVKSGRTY